jgi:hypothetical protein
MSRTRLWHDDIRRPPDASWIWARTNADAKRALRAHSIAEASLDHDLGLHDYDPDEQDADLRCPPDGMRPEEGWELVKWMIEDGCVPPRVTIHSWNPVGAQRMARMLADAGHSCVVRPYARDAAPTTRRAA